MSSASCETRPRPSWMRLLCQGLVTVGALLLLVYSGYGETLLTVKKLEQEQASAQAGLVQSAIERSLRSGLPLTDIAGLERLIQTTLLSSPGITRVMVADSQGREIYPRNRQFTGSREVARPAIMNLGADDMKEHQSVITFTMTLNGRLETEGYLQVELSKAYIDNSVRTIFQPLLMLTLGLVLLTPLVGWLMAGSRLPRFWRDQGWFTLSFSLLSILLAVVLGRLYVQTADNQIAQVNSSLKARLSVADSQGISLNMLSGINRLMAEYQRLNPELAAITLSDHNTIIYSADQSRIGLMGEVNGFRRSSTVVFPGSGLQLVTSMPLTAVVIKVLRAGRSFAILYLATLLLSLLLTRLAWIPSQALARQQGLQSRRTLEVVRPLFFLAVFLESLSTAILPGFLEDVARRAGLGDSMTSVLFMLYFLSFALLLLPANRLCRHWGNRRVLQAGFSITIIAALLLANAECLEEALLPAAAARILAGLGQGLLLVGVQNTILNNTTRATRSQGSAIIVTSFNGGFICGTALGALLSAYIDNLGVFLSSALTGALALVMVLLLPADRRFQGESQNTFAELGKLGRHRGFLSVLGCVGIPAKATLTGIVIFLLPLVMTESGFAVEDIGQMIIVYGLGVLAGTRLLSSVPLTGRQLLSISMMVSGMAVLGLAAGLSIAGQQRWLLAAGVIVGSVGLLGLAHGGINAPVVTYISQVVDERVSSVQSTVTLYRFFERFGHVIGPVLAGQLLIAVGSGLLTLMWLAVGLVTLALGFWILTVRSAPVRAREVL